MNRIHLSVNNMENAQNKTAIKNALEKVSGINMVNVDLTRGTVEVGFNEPASEDEIKSCIQKTGFFVD